MITVAIATSDGVVWNQPTVHAEIVYAMATGQPLTLDLLGEGPDLDALGIYDFVDKWATTTDYDLSQITVLTANAVEQHNVIKVDYRPPMHLVQNAQEYHIPIVKQEQLLHFGMFVGRGNAERLAIAAYVDQHYRSLTTMSYHYDSRSEFHTNNIGLEQLIKRHGYNDITKEANFLLGCPLKLQNQHSYNIDSTSALNPAQQLLAADRLQFLQNYQTFFVEIVCESYFTGNTFFPTEKIFRPILLKTPFIVQGPRYFLHRLREMGFKTFDHWWDEGYAEDFPDWQLKEITTVVDSLSDLPASQLTTMYQQMQPVLEHNYSLLTQLNKKDFDRLAQHLNEHPSNSL